MQYRFDIKVNPNYELTNYHISRGGKEICFFDKSSGLVEVTSHGYGKASPEVKKQAVSLCEEMAKMAGGK